MNNLNALTSRGLYISIDGPDGAGKSVQAGLLAKRLEDSGYTVVRTREPGGSELGNEIRRILLSKHDISMSSLAEFLLFSADRTEKLYKTREWVEAGHIVVSDRSFISSLAYQCAGGGVPLSFGEFVCNFIAQTCPPDATLIFDVDFEIGLSRRGARGVKDKMELKPDEYHRRVNNFYREYATDKQLLVIDGNQSIEEVSDQIWGYVEPLLLAKSSTLTST